MEEEDATSISAGEYAALTKSTEWVSLDEALAMAESVDPLAIFPDANAVEQLIPAEATDEEALKLAMDFERRGYTLYAQAAEDAETDEERKLGAPGQSRGQAL